MNVGVGMNELRFNIAQIQIVNVERGHIWKTILKGL